jgi:small-conductance mechanosensitive channel
MLESNPSAGAASDMRPFVLLICVLALTLPRVHASGAAEPLNQSRAEAPATTPLSANAAALQQEIVRKRASLQAEFDVLRGKLETAAQSETYVNREALQEEVSALRQIERAYGQQAAIVALWAENLEEERGLQEDLRRLRATGVPGERPFSFQVLDRLEDELDSQMARLASVEASVEFAREALEQASQAMDAAERARRSSQEELDTNRDPERQSELESLLHLARLKSQAAAEDVRLREIELANEKVNGSIAQLRTALLREQAAQVARDAQLTDKELAAQIARLDDEEFEITQALAEVRRDMMEAGAGASEPPAGDESRRWRRQTVQLQLTALNQRLRQIADLKQLWNRRYGLARGSVNAAELSEWDRQSRRQIERAQGEERVYFARLAELRRSLQAPEAASETAATPSQRQEGDAVLRIRLYELALGNTEGYRRAHERLLRQIQSVTEREPLSERLRRLERMLAMAWRYEIVAVQDRPITVGKVIFGLLLFLAGLYVSAFLSRSLGRRVWPRLGLDAGASAALQSLSYYVLVVLLTLFALQVVNVPLTLFTFVGGALAIGIGFGSQNLMNNFISGLILLAERPIKVGDLVEIGDMSGTVEGIGARSTRVRSYKNIHVIVPNSHFLEKEVVNWTLADDSVKTSVAVGVAYGSPTERVRDLLVEAVSQHEKIFATPGPTVLFKDFGENALTFEVHFWVRIRTTMEKWMVESDVRYRIDRLFRGAGIVIAFPQRDVHLGTVQPLEVRVRRE